MDGLRQKLTELAQKYRYFALVLLIGVFLMLLPGGKTEKSKEITPDTAGISTEERLCQILQRISGVGRADVMLTMKSGEETLYQNDLTAGESSSRSDTVIVTDSSRNQSGLVRQVNPPVYLGAIVVCEGGDRVDVKLAVMEAVSKITGLKYSQITVLKMK